MYTHLIAKIKPADGYRVMSLMGSQQNIFSDMIYALFNYSFRDCFFSILSLPLSGVRSQL